MDVDSRCFVSFRRYFTGRSIGGMVIAMASVGERGRVDSRGAPLPFHILIVDDQPDFTRLVELVLRHWGYHTTVVHSGRRAIAVARSQLVDAIILDGQLEDMDGLDVCRALREIPETMHLPVLMLTGRARPEDFEAAIAAGVDAYATKPILPDELLYRIRALLALRRPRAFSIDS